MLTPTRPPTDPLSSLAAELRARYTETFRKALHNAQTARARFETPDGTGPIDPIYAADTAACREINHQLHDIIERWLPGARLIDRIDEPAVIDSRWLHQQRTIAIAWDHTHDFADPNGLTVTEVTQ